MTLSRFKFFANFRKCCDEHLKRKVMKTSSEEFHYNFIIPLKEINVHQCIVGEKYTMKGPEERRKNCITERINYKHGSRSEEAVSCARLWSCTDEEKGKGAGKLCWNENARECQRTRLLLGVSCGKQPAGTGARRDEVGIKRPWRRPAAHRLHEKQGSL